MSSGLHACSCHRRMSPRGHLMWDDNMSDVIWLHMISGNSPLAFVQPSQKDELRWPSLFGQEREPAVAQGCHWRRWFAYLYSYGGDDDEYKSSGMTWGCEQLPVHEGGCLLKPRLILLRYDLWLYFLSLYFRFRYIWPLTRKPCWSAWISCPGLTVTPNTDMGTSHSTGATSTSGRM